MEKFEIGQLAHYNVGSDIYPVKIIEVSPSGKTVKTVRIRFQATPDPQDPYARVTEDRLKHYTEAGDERTWRSRGGKPHGDKYSRLKPGFLAYWDPHF